jgi:hypothetical protein
MSSEALLRQYLDTGVAISYNQYLKLGGNPNLKKTYLRKRYIVASTTEQTVSVWEFDDFSEEQKNRLKKYPRYLSYLPKEEQSDIINNFLDGMNENTSQTDVRSMLTYLPDEKKNYVIDKIFTNLGKKIDGYLMFTILSSIKKSDDEILEILYRWLDINDGYISPNQFSILPYFDKFNRNIHIKFLKKILTSSPEKWDFYTVDDYFKNLSANDIYPILIDIVARKENNLSAYPFLKSYKMVNIPYMQENLIKQYVGRMGYTFYLVDLIKESKKHDEIKNNEELDPINLVKLYLGGEKKRISPTEMSRLLDVVPENRHDELNRLVNEYAIVYENINRIKELL